MDLNDKSVLCRPERRLHSRVNRYKELRGEIVSGLVKGQQDGQGDQSTQWEVRGRQVMYAGFRTSPWLRWDFILSRERSNVRTFEQKDDMF